MDSRISSSSARRAGPVSGAWAVGTLFGIHLIFAGWAQVAIGSAARSVVSEMQNA